MMLLRGLLVLLVLLYAGVDVFANNPLHDSDQVYRRLDQIMESQGFYIKKREDKIAKLKSAVQRNQHNIAALYDKNYEIFQQYKKFQSDSALRYILICEKLLDPRQDSLRTIVVLDQAWIYSTIGRYIEASELLLRIDPKRIPEALLPKYYDTYSAYYSHYGQSNNGEEYYQASERYRDSLLQVLPRQSVEYRIAHAIQVLFGGDRKQAKELFAGLLESYYRNPEQRALLAYFMGVIYKQEKNLSAQQYYFAVSAIADMETANRDHASFQDLALTYYETGDFDRAFHFIEKAIDDAVLCNVRYRIVEGTSFYPIINAAYQQKINLQNKQLIILVGVVTLLLLGGIIGMITIYQQVQRLRRIRAELSETNRQLLQLNNEVQQKNMQLSESNHIKEEYIAQFFDMCSAYIDKMEDIRKALLKKAANQQWENIREQLKSTQMVEREVQQLYINFDRIFLNLYPSFIEEFNQLLQDGEQVNLKKSELLNTELRIFALIRLGITDSIKIASFLRYSLRTVYNYRTKMRNKALGDRDHFEDKVRHIAQIDRR